MPSRQNDADAEEVGERERERKRKSDVRNIERRQLGRSYQGKRAGGLLLEVLIDLIRPEIDI